MAVDHIPFNRIGLCGAASAQMVLHAQGLLGSTAAEQELLWSSIKAHTTGASTSKPCSGPVLEAFPKMIREGCSNGQVLCWSTYPDALKETLEAFYEFTGTTITITLRESDDQDVANDLIRKCLERGGLPIVLVHSGKHWVVVSEWHSNDPPSLVLLDPAGYDASSQTVDDWNFLFMSAVECGRYDRQYVVLEVDHDP